MLKIAVLALLVLTSTQALSHEQQQTALERISSYIGRLVIENEQKNDLIRIYEDQIKKLQQELDALKKAQSQPEQAK